MEKFMLLFRGSEVYQPDQSPEALQDLTEKMMKWVMDISEKGIHVSSEKLNRNGVQVSGSKAKLTNNPFGAAADIVGGCTIIRANNIDEAVSIAKQCPILQTNANIEVRHLVSV